jgi:hypothetical protein
LIRKPEGNMLLGIHRQIGDESIILKVILEKQDLGEREHMDWIALAEHRYKW